MKTPTKGKYDRKTIILERGFSKKTNPIDLSGKQEQTRIHEIKIYDIYGDKSNPNLNFKTRKQVGSAYGKY